MSKGAYAELGRLQAAREEFVFVLQKRFVIVTNHFFFRPEVVTVEQREVRSMYPLS